MLKKKTFLLLALLLACSFGMTALGACGDDDESATNGVGEVCVVAMLPESVAPYANLVVTYYDLQGNAKSFTVRNGESSDDLPTYSKTSLSTLELLNGFSIDNSKNIIRTVKFAVPENTKIACKYKVVLNGMTVNDYPSKTHSPFAVVTGKRPGGDVLVVKGTTRISQKVIADLDTFKAWLENIKDKETESFVEVK